MTQRHYHRGKEILKWILILVDIKSPVQTDTPGLAPRKPRRQYVGFDIECAFA